MPWMPGLPGGYVVLYVCSDIRSTYYQGLGWPGEGGHFHGRRHTDSGKYHDWPDNYIHG